MFGIYLVPPHFFNFIYFGEFGIEKNNSGQVTKLTNY